MPIEEIQNNPVYRRIARVTSGDPTEFNVRAIWNVLHGNDAILRERIIAEKAAFYRREYPSTSADLRNWDRRMLESHYDRLETAVLEANAARNACQYTDPANAFHALLFERYEMGNHSRSFGYWLDSLIEYGDVYVATLAVLLDTLPTEIPSIVHA